MQSFITPQFICGIFLFLVIVIGETQVASKNVPKIKQLTKPVEQVNAPYWDQRSKKLYYVDNTLQIIYRLDPATRRLTYANIANGVPGVIIPVKDKANQFLVGTEKDFLLVTWDSDEDCSKPIIEVLGTLEGSHNGSVLIVGKTDSHGRLWAGSRGPFKRITSDNPTGVVPKQGAVYRLTGDRVIKTVISPVTISSGIAWNNAGTTFYFVDTPTLKITAYDYDAKHGEISNERTAFDMSNYGSLGRPVGLTVDTDDNLWIGTRKGNVVKIDPVACKVLKTIRIPAAIITEVAWGGNSFDTLYVTTSRRRLTSAQIRDEPGSGSVFAITGLGARGRAPNLFSLKTKST